MTERVAVLHYVYIYTLHL